MREHPWNIRRATAQHYEWYRNLLDLHGLTLQWMKELKVEDPPHLLKRWSSTNPAETLETLQRMIEAGPGSNHGLDALLDDTTPEDLLGRLEHTIFTVQAWTLSSALESAPKSEHPALLNKLEQSSWKAGRACALLRWPDLDTESRVDLRGILAAFQDSPLSGQPGARKHFLIRRAIPTELQLDLHACPHHSPYPEVVSVADQLCGLHTYWIRGFAYALNTRVSIDYLGRKDPNSRCQLNWRFITT